MSLLLVMAEVVVDASALVDLLLGGPVGDAVARRIASHGLHGPAHLDSEVFSAMGRLYRAGEMDVDVVERLIGQLASAPIVRHPSRRSFVERGRDAGRCASLTPCTSSSQPASR